jgi:NADH-ubiquinone oxidoreductase chain 4
VLLKLHIFFILTWFFRFAFIWVSVTLVGGLLVGLICIRQMVLKSLIAYSSVTHMDLVIGGIMIMSYWGFCGSQELSN